MSGRDGDRLGKAWRGSFVTLPAAFVRDHNLSPEARMLAIYLISFAEGWVFHAPRVQRDLAIGRDKLARLLSELEHFGAIDRKQLMGPGGVFGGRLITVDLDAWDRGKEGLKEED